ncbi:hypothetical protein RGQ29_012167 [Quercus rubra]|uniref:B3 domain-containing protein n=1 Tax=Quercus rubra TaxID=3512 RepID=A0AAN7G0G5_QUERU|nr:hypothetical protein RGQ29_012167 [Quercus rubra]
MKGLLTLSLRPCTSITEALKPRNVLHTKKTQEGKDGQNRELALEIFEAKKENFATDEVIISSASESTGKEPIFYNFLPIPENDQLQVSQGNVFVTKTHHEYTEVSTELKLGYGSCITNKRKASENLANFSLSSTACGIKRMRLNSHKVEKGKGPNGVSLELKLGLDPWVIKKRIQLSDIGHLARLLLAADLVKGHILPQWDARRIEGIKNGVRVSVWDCDTKSEHQLIFKQWPSNGCYVLNEKWTTDFVWRRALKKGDEIGLYWDQSNSRFNFSILNRASSN